MKILSTQQAQQADQFTIVNEPISSINLMERAAKVFVAKFRALYPNPTKNILIFCGTGNNGGDGLAIARLLHGEHPNVQVFTIGEIKKGSSDFRINLGQLSPKIINSHLQSSKDFPEISPQNDIILDGLFGSGLSRTIKGLHANLINHLNSSDAPIISIDIASGLFADKPTNSETIIRPDNTISFQTPKLAFFQPSLYQYVGDWHIRDIGLNQDFIDQTNSPYSLTEDKEMRSLIPHREKFNHKGDAGRLLLIAGSKGKMGAAILATQAAFRAGAGLVYVHSPVGGLTILQTSIPEAMVLVDQNNDFISQINLPENINAMAIGSGIGTHKQTANALLHLIKTSSFSLILDADALNILSQHPDWFNELPHDSILTPHPGEFKRLVGEWEDDFDKLDKLRILCSKHKLNIVLKGANSVICDRDENIYFNSTGNSGMATAGSGDVLTGIIGALLAQGLTPIASLRLGVYWHGLSGDLAVAKYGHLSLKASDITAELPNALLTLMNA